MSDDFDPYYQWLGIPPKSQPADFYRLLGIETFESNPDVIAFAADQRMTHVRSFQNGPRMKWSQTLLNELSAARKALLDPAKKAAYDAELRGRRQAQRPTPNRGQENPPRGDRAASPAPASPVPAGPVPAALDKADGDALGGGAGPSAGDLLADLRNASRLTALETARLRLVQFQLPAAYEMLGEHLYREGHFRGDFSAEFAALDSLEADPPAKAARAARQRANLRRALGATAWRRYAAASAPPAVIGRLTELSDELARLEADIARVNRRQPGRVFSPRWIAILGGSLLAAMGLWLLGLPISVAFLALLAIPLFFAYRHFVGQRSERER